MTEKYNALVIRTCDYGESDRIIDVLTADRGKLTISVKGARSMRGKLSFCAHIMFYGELTVYEKDGRRWLREASSIRDFYDIDMGIGRLALAAYILEVAADVTVEGEDCSGMLTLTLNVLHVLIGGERPIELVKAVFELRCAAESGFLPPDRGCIECGKFGDGYFNILDGDFVCRDCFDEIEEASRRYYVEISNPTRVAMFYICVSPPKRIFAFTLDEELYGELSRVAESYLLAQTERGYKTLDYYKKITEGL